jgi:hypothetical protein
MISQLNFMCNKDFKKVLNIILKNRSYIKQLNNCTRYGLMGAGEYAMDCLNKFFSQTDDLKKCKILI